VRSVHVHGFVSLSFVGVSEETSAGPRPNCWEEEPRGQETDYVWGRKALQTKPGAQLVLSPSSEQTNTHVRSDSIPVNSFTAPAHKGG